MKSQQQPTIVAALGVNPLTRNSTLTKDELQKLTTIPHYFYYPKIVSTLYDSSSVQSNINLYSINRSPYVMYNLVTKLSNTGLFSNSRLLVLNSKTLEFGYISKIPQSIIPFCSHHEIQTLQFKEKIARQDIQTQILSHFNCTQIVSEKLMKLEFLKNQKRHEMTFIFASSSLLNQWSQRLIQITTGDLKLLNNQILNPTQLQQLNHISEHSEPKSKEKAHQQEISKHISSNINNDHQINHYDSQPQFQSQIPLQHSEIQKTAKIQHSQLHSGNQSPHPIKQNQSSRKQDNIYRPELLKESENNQEKTIFDYNSSSQRVHKRYKMKESVLYNSEVIDQRKLLKVNKVLKHEQEKSEKKIVESQVYSSLKQSQSAIESRSEVAKSKVLINHQNNDSLSKKQDQNGINWNQVFYSNKDDQLSIYVAFINRCKQKMEELLIEMMMEKGFQNYSQLKFIFDRKLNTWTEKSMATSQNDEVISYYLVQDSSINLILSYDYQNLQDQAQTTTFPHLHTQSTADLYFSKHNHHQYLENISLQLQKSFVNKLKEPPEENSKLPLTLLVEYCGLKGLCIAKNVEAKEDTQQLLLSGLNSSCKFLKANSNELLRKEDELLEDLANFEIQILSHEFLMILLSKKALSQSNIRSLFEKCTVPYFRRIFLQELIAIIFANIYKGELFSIYHHFPSSQFQEGLDIEMAQNILLDCAHVMFNKLLNLQNDDQQVWKAIKRILRRQYDISEKQDVSMFASSGYLMEAISCRLGLELCYDNEEKPFYKQHWMGYLVKSKKMEEEEGDYWENGIIERGHFKSYQHRVSSIDLYELNEEGRAILYVLQGLLDVEYSFLKTGILQTHHSISPQAHLQVDNILDLYSATFDHKHYQPYDLHYPTIQYFEHQLQISLDQSLRLENYEMLSSEKPSPQKYWLFLRIYQKYLSLYGQNKTICQFTAVKIKQIQYWGGSQSNTSLEEIYSIELNLQKVNRNNEKAVLICEQSLQNLSLIFGNNSFLLCEIRYLLSNIYYQMKKKQEAISQLEECKQLLVANQIQENQFAVNVFEKAAKIYVSMSSNVESNCKMAIQNGLKALKILEKPTVYSDEAETRQQKIMLIAQILYRAYVLSNLKTEEAIVDLCHLSLHLIHDTRSLLPIERLFKIYLFAQITHFSKYQALISMKPLFEEFYFLDRQQADTHQQYPNQINHPSSTHFKMWNYNYSEKHLLEFLDFTTRLQTKNTETKSSKLTTFFDRVVLHFNQITAIVNEILKQKIMEKMREKAKEGKLLSGIVKKGEKVGNVELIYCELYFIMQVVGPNFLLGQLQKENLYE